MLCAKCGQQLSDGVRFCTRCGAPVAASEPPQDPSPESGIPTPAAAPAPAVQESPVAGPVPAGVLFPAGTPGKKKSPVAPIVIACGAVLLVAAVALAVWALLRFRQQERDFRDTLRAAEELVEDQRYKQAVSRYQEALELRPDSVDAALGLAEAYLYQQDFSKAARALKDLEADPDGPAYDRLAALREVAALDPQITGVDASNFPTVSVTLALHGGAGLDANAFAVYDGGVRWDVAAVDDATPGQVTLSYLTDGGEDGRRREVEVVLFAHQFAFTYDTDYTIPIFEPAQVRLVSTDVSDYPTVRAYFRVTGADGATVEGLDRRAFVIHERVQGGQYLAREVRAAGSLERQGLNIDLVADKSDSIIYDMDKIKQVMAEFVHSLDYGKGDKAEVLAFDSIVQQMCYYTSDVSLLSNGIANMSPDGMTAFYDAVYTGIRNAGLQGGARCVIAFTDGMDNMSVRDAYDVINYANHNQVPVYVIGVGDAAYGYADTLRAIANGTGGRYWYIDDLYDLREIYDQIYAEQQELYVVEYTSDAADQYAPRDLQVSVTGGGFKGRTQASFTPIPSVQNLTHTSRYELIQGALTWEEASQRCQELGGHLATITSQAEQDQIVAMAEAAGLDYIWLGGYTSYDSYGNVFGHWVTGEDFSAYQAWCVDEPSRVDRDGTEEWYIMLWNIQSLGGWSWNDQRNDPAAAVSAMRPKMGFVCEYES